MMTVMTSSAPLGTAPPEGGPPSHWAALARNPLRYLISSDPWRGLGYLLGSLLFGWICFGLYIVIILLPFAPLWSYYLAKLERRRVRLIRMAPIVDPHPTLPPMGFPARVGERLGEAATWRETGYSLILAVLAPVLSIGVMIYGIFCLALLFAPMLVTDDYLRIGGWVVDTQWEAWLLTVASLPLIALGAYVCAFVSAALGSLAGALLGPRESELAALVTNLRASRGVLVDSFEGERRRIERDLHDGPQRDLVGLSMNLGELQLATEDQELRDQLADAQGRVEQVLAGLRDTVRGVHPQVLDDHGVAAACVELGQSIPVRVSTGPGWVPAARWPIEVERAMYYTASEAVTNAVKHASANEVTVTFDATGDAVTMEVVDDGRGGADIAAGTGLAGLVERAAAVGATLSVDSPAGGPTRLFWSKRR